MSRIHVRADQIIVANPHIELASATLCDIPPIYYAVMSLVTRQLHWGSSRGLEASRKSEHQGALGVGNIVDMAVRDFRLRGLEPDLMDIRTISSNTGAQYTTNSALKDSR